MTLLTPAPITPSIRTITSNSNSNLWADKYQRALEPIPYQTIFEALQRFFLAHPSSTLLEGPYLTKRNYIICQVITIRYGKRYIKLDPMYLNFVLA